ncbi:AMP-binding enzyme [delta proteobacterium NaphS2]|nr:AMP-binding enzyme [delta proteobacterium NaphS2]
MEMVPGIGSWLTKRAVLTPDSEAVVDGERRFTYRALNGRVNRLARALQGLGVKSGDRLSILSTNCVEYVETIMATAKLSVMLVPLNWRLTPTELAFMVNDSGARILIFHPDLSDAAVQLKDKTGLEKLLVLRFEGNGHGDAYELLLKAQGNEEPIPDTHPDLDTSHIIMYTAGTTGQPKGAVLSQGASFWNAVNLTVDMGFSSADRNLAVLPMFHIGGIGLFTLPMLYMGGTVVIQKTFEPERTLELLETENITLFFGVAAIFLFLIQHPNFKREAFDKVRVVMSGGAPLPVSLVHEYADKSIILQQGFGMSEAAPSIATLEKGLAIKKAGSIGRALMHVEARVVDARMKDVPTDAVGELVIRGPNLLKEYWNRPDATKEAFAGGWFHTGDLARMDPDGDLTIVERKKDMFISGGENVYPAEVEDAIYQLPQISETAVIGIKDEKWGEVGKAVVVLKKGEMLTEDAVLTHLKERLAKYKIPKSVVFTGPLPRNAAGKVLKNVLREHHDRP